MAKKTFIGRAFISITGDKRGLDAVLSVIRKDMAKIGQELQAIGYKFMATGAAIQAPLALAVRQFAQFGDQMAKAGKRVGLTAETFAELAHVAGLSGTNVGALEKSMLIMGRNMFQAGGQTKEFREAMSALGVTMADLVNLSPDQRFALLADRMKNIADPSRKAALAMQIFGRSGAQLIPLIDLGSEGIAHYREEFKRLHGELSPQAAGMAERLTDMAGRLKLALGGIAHTVGEILAPTFDKFLVYMTNLAANVREFVRNNPEVVTRLQQIAVAFTAAGAALVGLGGGLQLLAPLVSPGGVLLALAGVLVYISGVLDPLIEKWGTAILAFEVGGRTVSEWLTLIGKTVGTVWGTVKATLGSIAGVLGPVGNTVLAILDSVWQQVKQSFLDVKLWLLDELLSLTMAVSKALDKAVSSGKLGVFGAQVAKGYANAADALGGALTGARTRAAVDRQGQRVNVAGARENAVGQFGAMLQALGGVGGAVGGQWKGLLGNLGGQWGSALAPLLKTIFGEKGASGGVRGVLDIFKGLGRPFAEFQAPLALAAGPAMQAATATLGTFSGRGARAIGTDPILDVQREALDVLKSIDSKVGGGGLGGEEF